MKILCILNIQFPNSKSMRKTLKIIETSYYIIQNGLPKWRNVLAMCVQNRTPYCKATIPTVNINKLQKIINRWLLFLKLGDLNYLDLAFPAPNWQLGLCSCRWVEPVFCCLVHQSDDFGSSFGKCEREIKVNKQEPA